MNGKINRVNVLKILGIIAIFAFGVLAGYSYPNKKDVLSVSSVREESTHYKFINPLLFVRVPEELAFPKYSHLEKEATEYIKKATVEKRAVDMTIYFRDLNSSQWVGVNEEKRFSPGSMLKVVTLISLLRAAEKNPDLLSKTVFVTGDKDSISWQKQEAYPPADPILPGKYYTVEKLMSHLIIESDNTANHILYQLAGEETVNKTYGDLDLSSSASDDLEGNTPTEYSHVFRTLYNSTYLSRNSSEKILNLLSQSNFVVGLVGGVPKGVAVAHKFGVANLNTNQTILHELHDCGIVYHPDSPYFLCVMTRGTDFKVLESVLQEVSSLIWKEVERLN